MRKIIISAMDQHNVIGKSNGEIPWHVSEEYQHFKNTTIGSTVIMGRKTFESLKEPLKDRLNVVITNSKKYKTEFDNVLIFNSLTDSIKHCDQLDLDKVFIIGGGVIYAEAIDIADEMILSFMKFSTFGTVFFPEINYELWNIINEENHNEFTVKHFIKKT